MRGHPGCLLSLLASWGCSAADVPSFETCEIEVALEPASAEAAGVVVATGGPFLRDDQLVGDPARDTIVTVGGVRAEVVGVASVSAKGEDLSGLCNDCFACREEAECAACGQCDGHLLPSELRDACFFGLGAGETFQPSVCDECEQRLTFVVPDGLAPGPHTVSVLNRFGMSEHATLEVVDGAKTSKPTQP